MKNRHLTCPFLTTGGHEQASERQKEREGGREREGGQNYFSSDINYLDV